MENKSLGSRLGRFWWLWILCVILSGQIALALQFGDGFVPWAMFALINIPLLMIGAFLYDKSLKSDNKNGIPIKPLRNILLPWPKSAVLLAIFVLLELVVLTPLFAYTFYPCSGLDVIRKINGCIEHVPHRSLVRNISFSKDGSVFATSEFGGDIKIWSYPDLTFLNNLGNDWPAGAELSLSPNGEMIAVCGYKGPASILETRTGKVIHMLLQNNDTGCDVAFAADNNSVFVISGSEIQIWDVDDGKLSQSIVQDHVEYLEITNDGSYLATGSRDGLINIRRVSDGTIFNVIHQPHLRSLAFSHDGKYLITAGWDIESVGSTLKADSSTVNVWNIKTGKIERTITVQGIRIEYISSSKSNNMFVIGEESCFRNNRSPFEVPCSYFWHSIGDKMPTGLKVPYGVQSLIFSPVDDKILIGSYENLYVWKVP